MKKFLSLILMLIFMSTNSCLAISELYYIKNAKTEELAPLVESSFETQEFKLIQKNPYYAESLKDNSYAVVVLQQSGNNMFYYYNSDKNTKINKSFLKNLKNSYYTYEQSYNANAINIYDEIATKIALSNGVINNTYTFEEPQSVFTPPIENVTKKSEESNSFKGYIAQVPAGTGINVYLQNAINTSNASKGDNVTAVLTQDFKYNNMVIAPQGSLLTGTLTKANHATYGSRNGHVVIQFDKLVTPDNKTFVVSTEAIDFKVSNDGKFTESVKSAAGAAVAGAVVGLLAGLISGSDHVWRNVAIGAGVGAGSSAVFSTAERGVDAEIPSFTEMEVVLTKPISVSVNY